MVPAFVVEEFVSGVGEEVRRVDVPGLKTKAIAQAQADRPEEACQVQLRVGVDQVGAAEGVGHAAGVRRLPGLQGVHHAAS